MNKKLLSISIFILVVIVALLLFENEDATKQSIPQETVDLSAPFLRVHYIDVGQADATLLQVVENGEIQQILIDTGDWNRTDVLTYLEAQNIAKIDVILISHAHADHIGQLAKIIEQFEVEEVWMNGETAASQSFLQAIEMIEQYKIGYHEPEIGDTYTIGSLTLDTLHTARDESNSNNNSIAMNITYGDVKFLFTGDAEKRAEERMLERGQQLRAHVYKVGHHGSKTSNNPAFYEAVKPQFAIYSAGKNNSYGLPDQEVLDRISLSGTTLFGTDVDGTVIVETDGKRMNIKRENTDGLPAPLLNKSCISLNEASAEELEKIIHVGKKTAKDIIIARPFQSTDQLLKIKGIGESRLQAMKDQGLICTGEDE